MRMTLIACLAVLFAPGVAHPQDSKELPPKLLDSFRSDIRRVMKESRIPGLSIAFVAGRKLVWAEGFGKSDIENEVAAKAATSYRWASISKSVAGIAVMQQVERGKMKLDADIRTYVPEFPEKEKGVVTVRDLLCHQSGVRHYKGRNEILSTRPYRTLTEGLEIFKDDPLRFKPGTDYGYTTYGYTLLGVAVERTSGLDFKTYLKRHLFDPAGMETARDDSVFAIIPNRSQGYVLTASGLRNSTLADTSYKIPGGGMCGSVKDLARFAIAVLDHKLVSKETFAQMAVPQKTRDGKARRHGLGWTLTMVDGRKIVGHGGAQQRVSAWLGMVPKEGTAVVVISNLERTGNPISKMASGFMKRYSESRLKTDF